MDSGPPPALDVGAALAARGVAATAWVPGGGPGPPPGLRSGSGRAAPTARRFRPRSAVSGGAPPPASGRFCSSALALFGQIVDDPWDALHPSSRIGLGAGVKPPRLCVLRHNVVLQRRAARESSTQGGGSPTSGSLGQGTGAAPTTGRAAPGSEIEPCPPRDGARPPRDGSRRSRCRPQPDQRQRPNGHHDVRSQGDSGRAAS
jgi:hypothetical protein